MIRYAALRISLLVVVGVLLFLAGMRGLLLAGSTIIISALLAYIAFPSQRNQAAKRLEEIAHREEPVRVLDEDMQSEDAITDQLSERPQPERPQSERPQSEAPLQEPDDEDDDPQAQLH